MSFKPVFYPLLFCLLIPGANLRAQDYRTTGSSGGRYSSNQAIESGIKLYEEGKWGEAIVQLRRAKQNAFDDPTRAEAQFWIAISELQAGQYYDAIHDFDEVWRIDPTSVRRLETPYHKGRALYYLEKYIEAIQLFKTYADSIRVDGRYANGVRADSWDSNKWNSESLYNDPAGDYNRKASAIYWIGECYYSLGDLVNAEEIFNTILNYYRQSYKYEVSTNRLALIKEKKAQAELLDLMKSGQASAANSAQSNGNGDAGTTFNYDAAILAYKNRIAPYLLEKAREENNPNLNDNKDKMIVDVPVTDPTTGKTTTETKIVDVQNRLLNNSNTIIRLLAIKTTALEMMDRLISTLNSYEVIEAERR